MVIKAECHTDDHIGKAEFDALPWFMQANPQEIVDLANCGWGGDYPADAVASFMADENKDIEFMFQYLERYNAPPKVRDTMGFECHVDRTDAETWVKANCPKIKYDEETEEFSVVE